MLDLSHPHKQAPSHPRICLGCSYRQNVPLWAHVSAELSYSPASKVLQICEKKALQGRRLSGA